MSPLLGGTFEGTGHTADPAGGDVPISYAIVFVGTHSATGCLAGRLRCCRAGFYIVPREECEAVQDGGGLGQALVSRLQWASPQDRKAAFP